jgi:two-component system, NtrC family, response regulator AtoC
MSANKKTVLLCDDDQSILDAVSDVLLDAGYEVFTSHNHVEFLAQMRHCNPSVIILDVRMPERDGFWLAEGLQSLGKQIPIIFLTGYDSMIYRLYAPFVGSIAYLTKPVDTHRLLEKVHKATNRETVPT